MPCAGGGTARCRREQALLPSGGSSRASGRSCQWPPLHVPTLAAGLPLAALQRAVATNGLVAGVCRGSRPLRLGRWRQPLAGWPQPFVLAGLLPLLVATPCRGPGHSRPPLQGGWPEIIYLCILDPDGEDEGGQASSSLAVSTDGSLERNSSNLISQLLHRGREENRR
ncbi:hypothetical protein GW17_00059119 [Ensete ventricosum]|nr:hypothetical protein GW17_00059119 [Ensete ventricosum]